MTKHIDIAAAAKRYQAFESIPKLARAYGLSVTAMTKKLRDHGVTIRPRGGEGAPRKLTPKMRHEMSQLKASGLTGTEIARRLDISPSLVYSQYSFAKDDHKPVLRELLAELEQQQKTCPSPSNRAYIEALKGVTK